MASVNCETDFFDDLLDNLSNDIEQQNFTDLSNYSTSFPLDNLLSQLPTASPPSYSLGSAEFNSNSLTPNGNSPDRPIYSEPSPGSSVSDFTEKLTIIAEPFYGNKLRYRSDFQANQNRLGTLKNRTKHSSYQGPAIRDSSTIFTK